MEPSFWREVGQCWESDGEMETQVPGATYLRLSDWIKTQMLEIWGNGETRARAQGSQLSSQSLLSDILLVA